jgi:hypothetical protein
MTTVGDASTSVRWLPTPLAGDYRVTATVSNGETASTDSIHIAVTPTPEGSWIGAVDLSSEPFDRAGFCIISFAIPAVHSFAYIEVRSNDSGTEGRGVMGDVQGSSTFEYPYLSADFAPSGSTNFPRPLNLAGTLSPNGTQVRAQVELESGAIRHFDLERVALCTWDQLNDYVR